MGKEVGKRWAFVGREEGKEVWRDLNTYDYWFQQDDGSYRHEEGQPRPTVGDRVCVDRHPFYGQCGEIITDDESHVPYQIRGFFQEDLHWDELDWFGEDEVRFDTARPAGA